VTLVVLGSGSRGNAVALATPDGVILIDAGFGPRTLARRLRAAGLPTEPILGILITHEHGDHARGAIPLARKTHAPILASAGTLRALRVPTAIEVIPLSAYQNIAFAGMTVTACPVPHDAAEPIAVSLEGFGHRVAVALDVGRTTSGLELLLRGASTVVLEANHDDILLRTGGYPPSVRERIAGSGGHLSNRAAAELLESVCHAGLETVVLAHLSAQCNTPALARAAAIAALRRRGFRGNLLVAAQDQPLAIPAPRAA
jgi:phosphoribosyl 1,2-cyclic phosphodiesterase